MIMRHAKKHQLDNLYAMVCKWKLDILLEELKRRSQEPLISEQEINDFRTNIPNLTQLQRETVLKSLYPAPSSNNNSEYHYFSKLKTLGVVRVEILKLLNVKKDLILPAAQTSFIHRTLNETPSTIQTMHRLLLKYHQIIDYIIPSQWEVFNTHILNPTLIPAPHTLSNRLYFILQFILKTPEVDTSEVLEMIKLQTGIKRLFNSDGEICDGLNSDSDKFNKVVYWTPTAMNEFNKIYNELVGIQRELYDTHGINLYRIGDNTCQLPNTVQWLMAGPTLVVS
jgi:hypothetical protein